MKNGILKERRRVGALRPLSRFIALLLIITLLSTLIVGMASSEETLGTYESADITLETTTDKTIDDVPVYLLTLEKGYEALLFAQCSKYDRVKVSGDSTITANIATNTQITRSSELYDHAMNDYTAGLLEERAGFDYLLFSAEKNEFSFVTFTETITTVAYIVVEWEKEDDIVVSLGTYESADITLETTTDKTIDDVPVYLLTLEKGYEALLFAQCSKYDRVKVSGDSTITANIATNTQITRSSELYDHAMNDYTAGLLEERAGFDYLLFSAEKNEFSFVTFTETITTVAYIVVEWERSTGTGVAIEKNALEETIALVTGNNTSNWHQAGDRYNGKLEETITDKRSGFWMELIAEDGPLASAQAVYDKANATQTEVYAAAEALSAAIAKLIPIDQLNATALYEALQGTVSYSWDDNSTLYLGNFTSGTAATFEAARENAQAYLDSLFDNGIATEINIAANQSVADGYASTLLTARNNLLSKELLEDVQKYRDTIVKLDTVFKDLDSEDYSNWSVFAEDKAAAAALIEEHPVNENLTRSQYDLYASTARDYWLAAYGLRSKAAPKVTVYFSDDFGMRHPEHAMGSAYAETLTMEDGTYTLKELLTQAGLTTLDHLGTSRSYDSGGLLWDDWLVYINGVLVRDPRWVGEDTDQTILLHNKDSGEYIDWNEVCVRDGDVVTVARVEAALMPPTAGVGAEGAYFLRKSDYFGQLMLTLGEDSAEEGESISTTVLRYDSYLLSYDGRTKESSTAWLAAYGPRNEDGSWPTEPTIVESGTELTLYQAGVYLVTAFEPREQSIENMTYPNLTVSSLPLLVTVTPLSADELGQAREDYAAQLDAALADCDADMLGPDAYADAASAAEAAKAGLKTAASLAEMQELLETALSKIEALKADAENANAAAVGMMRGYLKFLPDAQQLAESKFTQNDVARMGWASELYDSMTGYQQSLLTAEETQQWQALEEAFGTDGSALPNATPYTLSVSVVNGNNTSRLYLQGTYYVKENAYGGQNWGSEFTGEQNMSVEYGALRDDLIYVFFELPVDSEEDSPLQSADIDGAEIHTSGRSYSQRQDQLYVSYWYNLYNPRRDFTIVFTLPANDELSLARSAAVKEVNAAYAAYSKSDYTSENWTALTAAYSAGVAAINEKTNTTEIDTAKQAALDAMAAVERKTPGDLGSVTVIVENTTYTEGDLTGTLVSTTVDLTQQSTMMKCVLTALADAGYSWTGTGGSLYEISYLSSIYITVDGVKKSLSEFGAGNQSGWMGTLNDWFVNEGFNTFTVANGMLKDGDVIQVEYTVTGYGTDLGATWANNDTSLVTLDVDGGSLAPEFSGDMTEYVLKPTGGSVSFQATAANKNFQVRIFLNQQNKAVNAEYYRSGEAIPVKTGDVIWIGVGEKAWPTMNDGTINGTWYKINVVSEDDANAVVKLISAIGSVTYSNYKDKQAAVDLARAAYEALNSEAKDDVTNYPTLTKAEDLIKGYQKVGTFKAAIAALPKIIEDTEEVRNTAADYEELKGLGLNNLLTMAEINKIELAAELLDILDEADDAPDFTTAEANQDGSALKEALEARLSGLADSVSASVDSVTAAVKGQDGNDGSYTATLTFKKGNGTAKKVIGGAIERSGDTSVSEIIVNDKTRASETETGWAAKLPYGSDRTTAAFAITTAPFAEASALEMTKNDGSAWTFTVTAEDGSTEDYTVALTVSEVIVTVLDSNVYDISDDTVVTSLSPVGVSGLDAINADDLILPEGTKEAYVWLTLKIKERSDDEMTLTVSAWYAADGKEAGRIPDEKLKNVKLEVTVPLAGTEYAKVRFGEQYLDATGSASGIAFAVAAAGDYTLIPDASLVTVTFHLNGGTSTTVTDGQQIVYFPEDVNNKDLPRATREGDFSFEGWFADKDGTGKAYTVVSKDLPTDLYAVWKSLEDVNVIERVDKTKVTVETSIEEDGTAVVTVKSADPCVVILKDGDSYVKLEAKQDGDSYVFRQEDYEEDMVFIVAAKGDFDGDGDLDADDFTAANLTILGNKESNSLQLLVMGAKGKTLKTVDLAKLYLALVSGKVEW